MSLATAKAQAKTEVKNLLDDMLTKDQPSTEEYAHRLINTIEAFIKAATIKYTAGLTAPSGPVTGIFNGSLE